MTKQTDQQTPAEPDEGLWTIAEAADRLGVSRRTLYRYMDRHQKKMVRFVVERDGGIKVTAQGVEFFRSVICANNPKPNPPKASTRKVRVPLASEPALAANSKDAGSGPPAEPEKDEPRPARTTSDEDKTAPYISALLSQIEDLREERNRLVREVDDFRDLARRLQEERDRLLFETAEWRGLYGRIEDQRALVVRQPSSESWVSRAWKTISEKVSGK